MIEFQMLMTKNNEITTAYTITYYTYCNFQYIQIDL